VPDPTDELTACCDEFDSAVATTFANPIDSPSGWLLYGTDYESVSAGHPELRYWPIRFCPFCGTELALPPPDQLRRSRRFGFG
jgi:hypothetical protein